MNRKLPVLRVPKGEGQSTLSRLKREGRLDPEREIGETQDHLIIPVLGNGNDISDELSIRIPVVTPFEKAMEYTEIPDDLKVYLPSRWEKIGDILLIKLDPVLEEYRDNIGEGYARALDVKTVLLQGDIVGQRREPVVDVIYGGGTETIHLENSIRYKLDTSKIMFSSGNVDERIHMSQVDLGGEVVVDMFAGIGYFSLPIAVKGKPNKVYSLEINPVAHGYLTENTILNDVEHIIRPILGDNRDFELECSADRVIMGYLHDTWKYIPKALEFLDREGFIHLHTLAREDHIKDSILEQLKSGGAGDAEVLDIRNIKSYAPRVFHVVADLYVR